MNPIIVKKNDATKTVTINVAMAGSLNPFTEYSIPYVISCDGKHYILRKYNAVFNNAEDLLRYCCYIYGKTLNKG